MHFNLVPRREECIETHNKFRMTLEERRNSANDAWSVDTGKQDNVCYHVSYLNNYVFLVQANHGRNVLQVLILDVQ